MTTATETIPEFAKRPRTDRAEVAVRVNGVSKKFCKNLKKSLWYGVRDMAHELIPFARDRFLSTATALRTGEFWAVREVGFELRRGECLGLIGHNGAGKTTLLRMLNGLIKPDTGRIEMRGRVGALIALGAGFNPILTGRENIYVNASVLGLTKAEIDDKFDEIVEYAEIRNFIDAPVQSYSSGMAVRLGFAIAAKTEPDILLLDEVLAVGDVSFQAKCFNTLSQFRANGTAFIIVSHNMHTIFRYADTVLYLNRGRRVHLGDPTRGIEHYLEDMSQADSTSVEGRTDWSRVYGSGKVVLTSSRFRNQGGAEVTAIDVGDGVTLEIDYERREELEEPPLLDVVVRDREGIIFQGTNENSGQPFDKLSNRGCFRVHFPAMPTNVDRVDFFVAVLEPNTAEVYDWKRNLCLKIRRNSSQQGKLFLPVDWKSLPRSGTNSEHQ